MEDDSNRKRKYYDDEYYQNKRPHKRSINFKSLHTDISNFIAREKSENYFDDNEFWNFFEKYEKAKKRDPNSSKKACQESRRENFLNFEFTSDALDSFSQLTSSNGEMNSDRKQEILTVMLHYIDFKQKSKYIQLRKLRESQRNLPVYLYKQKVISSVKENRVTIIAGDTGCGKSTQIPQYLLQAGFTSITCTQPRRIACISLSKRVAYETLSEFSSEIGYQIRFEKHKYQQTKVIFVTEGLLLRQLSSEFVIEDFSVIILDEIHERHLQGDFLLGLMKCLLVKQPKLKLILMSATINLNLFQRYMPFAHVIQVPGRLFPIQLHYMPLTEDEKKTKTSRINPAPYLKIMQLIDHKFPSDEKGDMLIFLSGTAEITAVIDVLSEYSKIKHNWIILPLHSTLPIEDQEKVFDYPPPGIRKCIVSTNIAETSVTIDGIRFVIDSGMFKQITYDPISRMQRLKEFPISKASAEQRKGRAGRTGPGICYRIYSQEWFENLDEYGQAEIERVPLDSVTLQMLAMGLPDVRKFPYLEPPPEQTLETTLASLKHLGALTEDEKVTSLGHMLNQLPLELSLGKMLVQGTIFRQRSAVLTLAAALSVQSPIIQRTIHDKECERARQNLESDHGEPILLLNAFRQWLDQKKNQSHDPRRNDTRKWCRRHGLEEQRFYEMVKLRNQFKNLLEKSGLVESQITQPVSSAERSQRHGELRQLKKLRREHQEEKHQTKRMLKYDPWGVNQEEREDDSRIDIQDIMFRLSNTSGDMANLAAGSQADSYATLILLKVILCSGMYPQFAIADVHNISKTVSDQLFHTRTKPYISLHPNDFFYNNPKILQLGESEIIGFSSTHRLPISTKHQLLCYMSLLETSRPYLMTTFRIPAAQALLLFSKKIATNYKLSKIVCDSWIRLEFPTPETGIRFISKVTLIRAIWDKLLNRRLTAMLEKNSEEEDASKNNIESAFLTKSIIEFMQTEIPYTIERLMAADEKIMYIGHQNYNSEELEELIANNPIDPAFDPYPDPIKGGIQLSNYFIYNCLSELPPFESNEDDSILTDMQPDWNCPDCHWITTEPLSPLSKIQHWRDCAKEQLSSALRPLHAGSSGLTNSKSYDCEICKKSFFLTPFEVLKHKQEHLKNSK